MENKLQILQISFFYLLYHFVQSYPYEGQNTVFRRSYQKGPPVLYDGLLLPISKRVGFEGQTLKLPCPVHPRSYSHGPVIFQWTKDGEEINSLAWSRFSSLNEKVDLGKFERISSEKNYLSLPNNHKNKPPEGSVPPNEDGIETKINFLNIEHSSKDDTGNYMCKALNGFGTVQLIYTLVVVSDEVIEAASRIDTKVDDLNTMDRYSNTIPGAKPEFKDTLLPPFSGDFKETPPLTSIEFLHRNVDAFDSEGVKVLIRHLRTSVTLECPSFRGSPVPKIAWFKNNQILWLPNKGSEGEDLSMDQSSALSERYLKIEDLRSEDEGFYTCKVYNYFGTLNKTFFLEVVEHIKGPNLIGEHPLNITVQASQEATLRCDVRSELQPYIQWLKRLPPKDREFYQVDYLRSQLPDIQLLHEGGKGTRIPSISTLIKRFTDQDVEPGSYHVIKPLNTKSINSTAWSEENGQIIIRVGRQRFVVIPSDRSLKQWTGPNGQYFSELKVPALNTTTGSPNIAYYVCMVVNAVGYDFRGAYVNTLPKPGFEIKHDIGDVLEDKISNDSQTSKPTYASQLSLPALVGVPILSLALVLVAIFTTRSFFPRSEKAKLAIALFDKKNQPDGQHARQKGELKINTQVPAPNSPKLMVNTNGHNQLLNTDHNIAIGRANVLKLLFGCCCNVQKDNYRRRSHFKPHEAASSSFSAYMSLAVHAPNTNGLQLQLPPHLVAPETQQRPKAINNNSHAGSNVKATDISNYNLASTIKQSTMLGTSAREIPSDMLGKGSSSHHPQTLSSRHHRQPISPLNKLKFYRIDSDDDTDVGSSVSRQKAPKALAPDRVNYYESYAIAEVEENSSDGDESSYRASQPLTAGSGQRNGQLFKLPHPAQFIACYEGDSSSCCCDYELPPHQHGHHRRGPQNSRLNNSYADEYFSLTTTNQKAQANCGYAAPSITSDLSESLSYDPSTLMTPRPILCPQPDPTFAPSGNYRRNINFSRDIKEPIIREQEADPEGSSNGRTNLSPQVPQNGHCHIPNNSLSINDHLNTTYPINPEARHDKHTNAYYMYSL